MNFFQTVDPRRIPENIHPEDSLLVFRERILQTILVGIAILGLVAVVASAIPTAQRGQWVLVGLYIAVYLGILFVTYRRRMAFPARAGLVLFMLYILGVTGLLESGLSGDGRVFLIVFAVMSAIFLGMRAGIAASAFSILTLILAGWLMTSGRIPMPPVEILANSGNPVDWTTGTIIFISLTMVSTISIYVLARGLERTVADQRRLADDLLKERARLEERVQERTVELERRANDLQAASRLARDISSATSLDSLLNNAVKLIRSQFGFYHAGIFLLDARREFAILHAATGEAGQAMLERGHRLMVGEVGLVGHVVSSGEPRITEDVELDHLHYKNPLLPATRAEMAIPLRSGNTIIGALDVQSERPGAFSQQDVTILQTIADQLAVAIDKARLVARLEQNLEEVKETAGEQAQKTWRTHLTDTRKVYAYRCDSDGVHAGVEESPESTQAYRTGQMVSGETGAGIPGEEKAAVVAIPIQLRQQVIGVLDVRFESGVVTQDLIDLLQVTTNRLALALDNARLLEAIQVRAEREHVVSDISAKVRSSTDIDSILRTAAAELGRSIGISEVMVQLRTEK